MALPNGQMELIDCVVEGNKHAEDIIHRKYSQEELILNCMRAGNSITSLEALRLFGCFRLASRISDLRKQGHLIQSAMIETTTGKRVKKYWI